MKTDEQLKKDVEAELEWGSSLNAAHVGVAVNNGVVTLTGHLDTYTEKSAMERAVARVEGVHAIAVEVDVKLDPSHKRSDTEIAAAAESALMWHSQVPTDRVKVKVEKGWITLKGELDWDYQRRQAEHAVRSLTGVVGVINNITIKSVITPANVITRIRDAFTRHAEREAQDIAVSVRGSVVTLRGSVDSWAERGSAFAAAWAAPGISDVVNEIKVRSRA